MIQVMIIFAALLITLEFIHFCERKDLYDRAMSRDFDEYKRLRNKEDPSRDTHEAQHKKAVKEWRKGM